MLTSTAAERKRTVAACRALRAQIQQFEDACVQLHGHPPKGAAERAPLATTYAQYREWKRAIRADAACRIQALFRGARTRWMLIRRNSSRLTRVVMKRAGRSFGHGGPSIMINQISIPVDIGDHGGDRVERMPTNPMIGVESATTGSRSLNPQWSSNVARWRSNSDDRGVSDYPPSSPGGRNFTNLESDIAHLSLSELQARKRELKQQLKQYDMNFARCHGRMPVKAEVAWV